MSALMLISALLGLAVMALLLVEYYQQPLLAVAVVAVGFAVVLWLAVETYYEWR